MAFKNSNGDLLRVNLVDNWISWNNGGHVQCERETIEQICIGFTKDPEWTRVPVGNDLFRAPW